MARRKSPSAIRARQEQTRNALCFLAVAAIGAGLAALCIWTGCAVDAAPYVPALDGVPSFFWMLGGLSVIGSVAAFAYAVETLIRAAR